MFDAQLLVAVSSPDPVTVLSPWLPRQGDYVLVTAQLLQAQVSAGTSYSLEITALTKNSDDTTDGGSTTGSAISYDGSTLTTSTSQFSALKELVRFQYTLIGNAAGDWALFRMLSPVWFDAVKA